MNSTTDQELLREYAECRAEAAFGELVRRHVDLVYSAAVRMVRDVHLAQDVTQGVFLALSQNARQLTEHPVLSGWLHRTTQNIAANAIRSEVRRRAREQEAAAVKELISTEPDATWEEVAPQLDAALGELSEPDRDALLLRYFERKSARQMAQTLGTSEEAAQKRVSRAVDRLRELLAKEGVTASAGGLIVLITGNAVQAAPAGLVLSITTSVALAGTAVATMTSATAAKTLAMTTLQKTLITAALAAAIGVSIYEGRRASGLHAQVKMLQTEMAGQLEASQSTALESLQSKVQALQVQTNELASALSRAMGEKAQLETEREQAKRSAALYRELVQHASAKDPNPTNAYPTPRHAWAALGRVGRVAALSKGDESKLSTEEKSALQAAQIQALGELPSILKAMKQLDVPKPGDAELSTEDVIDHVACLLYGALNLDEQQFNQACGVMQKLQQEAKEKGYSKQTPGPEAAEAVKQILEQWKTETQTLLTPEQSGIFMEVVNFIQVEPGKFGFNVSF